MRGAQSRSKNVDFEDVKNLGPAIGVQYESEAEKELDAAALSMELASVMHHQGRCRNAETMQLSAIEIQIKHWGECLEVSRSLEHHAETVRKLERLPEAEAILKRAMEMREGLVGPWDSEYFGLSQTLQDVLEEQGKMDEVDELLVRRHQIDWQV